MRDYTHSATHLIVAMVPHHYIYNKVMEELELRETRNGFHYVVKDGKRIFLSKAAEAAYLEGYDGVYDIFDVLEDAKGKKMKKPFTVLVLADKVVGTIKLVKH